MPKLTVLVHTKNNAKSLGQLLDALKFCNDLLVIDDDSEDRTVRIACKHHARVKKAIPGVTAGAYAMDSFHPWVLVVRPDEMPNEELIRALKQWKAEKKQDEISGYAIAVREQRDGNWNNCGAQMRLVNRLKINWTGELPPDSSVAGRMPGELLRTIEEEGKAE
ncbi:MAG TPA: hypothetical protein VN622_06450 [Clostridia bacterium]|nr:hypothetical protein [Clostridia bacterium]